MRGSEGIDKALPFPANPAIPRDPNPGQRARTAAEEAIAIALRDMSPADRRKLLRELAEEEAPTEKKGAA